MTEDDALHDRENARQVNEEYLCYIIKSNDGRKTYVGITNNFTRRLRQHNGELVGGAKYTSRQGARPWRVMLTVHGFQTKVQALQFEWALHHMKGPPGPAGRIKKLQALLHKHKWTKPSPLAASVPLELHVVQNECPANVDWSTLPAHCRWIAIL